jgi:hypothetical protein
MILVISSPSSSTTGLATLILFMDILARSGARYSEVTGLRQRTVFWLELK